MITDQSLSPGLGNAARHGRSVRNRLFETFKRDILRMKCDHTVVEEGHSSAHFGDCLEDAQLWESPGGQPRLREPDETNIYEAFYGLTIETVRAVKDSPQAIEIINYRGTIAGNRYLADMQEEKDALFEKAQSCIMKYSVLVGDQRKKAFSWPMGKCQASYRAICMEYNRLFQMAESRRRKDIKPSYASEV